MTTNDVIKIYSTESGSSKWKPGYGKEMTGWEANVPVDYLLQYREYDRGSSEKIEAIKEDISKHGIHTPVMLQIGTYGQMFYGDGTPLMAMVSEGNHRIEAAKQLGLKSVPTIVGLNNSEEWLNQNKSRLHEISATIPTDYLDGKGGQDLWSPKQLGIPTL